MRIRREKKRLRMILVIIHGIEAIISPIRLANRITRIAISE